MAKINAKDFENAFINTGGTGKRDSKVKIHFFDADATPEEIYEALAPKKRVVPKGLFTKYNPDQPRVPAGEPGGGQWTSGGGGGSGSSSGSTRSEPDLFKPSPVEHHYRELKSKWSQTNNELLSYINTPDAPIAQTKMNELKAIVKEMHTLRVERGPSDYTHVGLPGGARDVVIVGAGPGGLSAGIMGRTEGMDILLVEANTVAGGQAKYSSRIENFPGFPIGVTGEQLTKTMFDQAERMGVETKLGTRVTGLRYDAVTGLKTLTLPNGESVTARSVVLACGVEFRKLEFGGSEGPGVIYGDGKALAEQTAGKSAVVIGGSNGAAQAALGAAETAEHVYVLARSPIVENMSDYQVHALQNNPKITVIEGDQIQSLTRDELGKHVSVTTAGGHTIPAAAVGVFAGSAPNTKWLPESIRHPSGKIMTNNDLETSIPGVYAVGDTRQGGMGRIGVAVGEGQIAILASRRMKEAVPIQQIESIAYRRQSSPQGVQLGRCHNGFSAQLAVSQ